MQNNPLFRTDCSISDSLKSVRKSVLIYETMIEYDNVMEIDKKKSLFYYGVSLD